MKLPVLLAFYVLASSAALAEEASQCRSNGGNYLTGSVTQGPVFARGRHPLRGIMLSHTHVMLLADQDHQPYDIAIDNVFAQGYDAAGSGVPAPLSSIHAGNRLEVCGRPYRDDARLGIDWVHTNCGAAPTNNKPDGWIKVLGANGSAGPNLESYQKYCYLWHQQPR